MTKYLLVGLLLGASVTHAQVLPVPKATLGPGVAFNLNLSADQIDSLMTTQTPEYLCMFASRNRVKAGGKAIDCVDAAPLPNPCSVPNCGPLGSINAQAGMVVTGTAASNVVRLRIDAFGSSVFVPVMPGGASGTWAWSLPPKPSGKWAVRFTALDAKGVALGVLPGSGNPGGGECFCVVIP